MSPNLVKRLVGYPQRNNYLALSLAAWLPFIIGFTDLLKT
jgi:hypothetical protein